MGSKNSIAKEIVDFLPPADNFYDLFAGGCAITQAAIETEKYKNFYINDIDPMPTQLFMDAINGKLKDRTEWISREDFYKLVDSDPFVRYCWSFGSNGQEYMYGHDLEALKEEFHKAVFEKNYYNRYLAIKRFLKIYDNLNNAKCDKRLNQFQDIERYKRCLDIERYKRCQDIECYKRCQDIERTCTSYDEIEIKRNSIIYCDIPYRNKKKYKLQNFNYEKFYDWAENQTQPIFISECEMPEERFRCVWQKAKRRTYSSTNNSEVVIEKLFVPIKSDFAQCEI